VSGKVSNIENLGTYWLSIEVLVTEGSLPDGINEKIAKQVAELPTSEKQSEVGRLTSEYQRTELKVLQDASFGMLLDHLSPAYQTMKCGSLNVMATAQLLDPTGNEQLAKGYQGIPIKIVTSANYGMIGGVSQYAPPHLPMIPSNHYFLSSGGNPKCYVSKFARLTEFDSDSVPDLIQLQSLAWQSQLGSISNGDAKPEK